MWEGGRSSCGHTAREVGVEERSWLEYMRSPEQTDSQRQKVEWWSPGAGERGIRELVLDGDRVSVLQGEKTSTDG